MTESGPGSILLFVCNTKYIGVKTKREKGKKKSLYLLMTETVPENPQT